MKTTTGPEIAAKIDVLIKKKGITRKQFERDCGLSTGYMRKLTDQKSTPSADRLLMIAEFFDVSTDFLLSDKADQAKPRRSVKIPLLGRVAAGIPIEASENVIGNEEISSKMARKGEFFALLIQGDSMSPYILDGDKVIVRQQDTATEGDIVVALINGNDGVCKDYKPIKDGVVLSSRNPSYAPMVFTHSEIDTQSVKIIGKVVEIRRSL